VIELATVVKIFASCMGVWAMGYGIGKSVAWTRHIANVA